MSRPSREQNRDLAAAPIDVLVPAAGSGAGGATIGGVPVAVVDGEDVQQAVLAHLHRIALATGHPVHATIRDERHNCVVPLQVNPDGSSHLTASPASTQAAEASPPAPTQPYEPQTAPGTPSPPPPAALSAPPASPSARAPLAHPSAPAQPFPDRPTHLLRQTAEAAQTAQNAQAPEPVKDAAPAFPFPAVSEPQPLGVSVPTFPFRAVEEVSGESAPVFAADELPEPVEDRAPGTVAPPTGVFGPPPVMDAVSPRPAPAADGVAWPPGPALTAALQDAPTPRLTPLLPSSSDTPRIRPLIPALDADADADPRPTATTPTPARGFDAVAEAVLGDEPPTVPGFLMEPMVRVNEAVREGRLAEAGELAGEVVGQASARLGAEHLEVLKVRELAAYIAYLAGEPVRAFRLSLDLALIHRRARDAEGAYGNVQSAASAWRAVRDPELGLALGQDLIGLWTELAAEGGPAAEDVERLASARTRMGRLTERARKAAQQQSS